MCIYYIYMCIFSVDSIVFIYVCICICMCGDLLNNILIFFIFFIYFRYIFYEKRVDVFGL